MTLDCLENFRTFINTLLIMSPLRTFEIQSHVLVQKWFGHSRTPLLKFPGLPGTFNNGVLGSHARSWTFKDAECTMSMTTWYFENQNWATSTLS